MQQQIILASQSPRRAEILNWLGIDFLQYPADIDETRLDGESAQAYVTRLAEQKAQACASMHPQLCDSRVVLGSDTTVAVDEHIFEKPEDEADMCRMLSLLSGRVHQVYSGIALYNAGKIVSACVATDVRFRVISDAEMHHYWQSGEPLGKAGGYAIQGLGGQFVEHISGSYTAVMGLPLFETAAMLRGAGILLRGADK